MNVCAALCGSSSLCQRSRVLLGQPLRQSPRRTYLRSHSLVGTTRAALLSGVARVCLMGGD